MEALTAELMTSGWRPVDVSLSPDGRTVAWVAEPYGREGEHEESAIWVRPVDQGEPARRWTWGGADRRPRWSPDGTRLAFLSDRAERGTAGLYVLTSGGGEARPLAVAKRPVGDLAWSPDGARIAFLVPDDPTEEDERREKERDDPDVYGERWQKQRLRVVDVATEAVTELDLGDRHAAEVVWSPDGTRLACVVQETPELDFRLEREILLLPAAGGPPVGVHRGSVEGLHWTQAGRLVFEGSHLPGSSTSGVTVWSVDPQGGQAVRVAGGATDALCALSSRVAPGGPPAVLVAEGLATRIEEHDELTGGRGAVLHATEGHVGAFDVGGGVLAIVQADPDRLPEVYAGAPGRLRRLSDHHAELSGVWQPTPEAFRWRAADGTELDGVMLRPPGAGPGPLPTVVVPHGGPYGRTDPGRELGWSAWGTWLAGLGYLVLRPNYRGGAGRGRNFALAARGGVGGVEFTDVLSMVDAAIERDLADASRLGIGGWSQGGFLAAWAVTQTDRFRAAVVGAGPTEWDLMTMTSDLPRFEAELTGNRPWDGVDARRAAERSPIRYARNVRTPVLILHGQQDERVPVSQAIGFHRALRALEVPVALVTYPREPHGIAELAHQRDVLRRVRDWFDRWLRAGESVAPQ